ncbi:hypothetical protein ILP92_06735 [Maribius pontilimi]|uniref:DUF6603 domain-containing protein n=1 Tax=Palleronia pontilimi TaxID=1964209 RepID=A0A934MC61_9RHOB|nr:DUF6603 domain-containing protein [Palleronia pontilimi]MBJ3762438.1 hypothetical protein [Palleronia pontilimi]
MTGFTTLRREMLIFLDPLAEAAGSEGAARVLLSELSLGDPETIDPGPFLASLDAVGQAATRLPEEPVEIDWTLLFGLLGILADLLNSPVFTSTEAGRVAARAVIAMLVSEYLSRRMPTAGAMLRILGVLRHNRAGKTSLHIDALRAAFTDPAQWAQEVYGWGDGDQPERFAENATAVLRRAAFELDLGLGYRRDLQPENLPTALGITEEVTATLLPLIQAEFDEQLLGAQSILLHGFSVEAGFRILPLPGGLGLSPYARGDISRTIDEDGWTYGLEAAVGEADGPTLVLRPGDMKIVPGVRSDASLKLFAATDPEQSERLRLDRLGMLRAGGPRIEVSAAEQEGVGLTFGVENVSVEFRLGGDGFLAAVLPSSQKLDLGTVGLSWQSGSGPKLIGGDSLGFQVPVALQIGPVFFSSIDVSFGKDETLIELGTAVSVTLGPATASIDGIGIRLERSTDERPRLVARPPVGIGMQITNNVVSGGGFLSFEPEKGRYSGALALQIGEIGVSAVGLLVTKLPDANGDGAPDEGFSLILLIASDFPPIQLGFGFTLNALGGLVGIHRTVDADALRDGLRTQTLDSIMFPKDPVARAPEIVRDLEGAFPIRQDQHVFGPMAKLGWGTPSVITAELGIVLELDSPLRLLILGKLRVGLPSLAIDTMIVKINMDLLGVIDFDRSEASLDAVLFDSKIALYTLDGEMAMRMRWGASPFFVLAIGGVHPAFERPPELPDLNRIAVSLGAGDNPRLRLECFVALTSNTVQFGAQLDARASAMGFTVEGWLGFDALFELEPFRFQVEMRAGLALKRGASRIMGVSLRLTLTGPSPYRASGTATVSLFFLDIDVPFDATFGKAVTAQLPQTDPWAPLAEAMAIAGNWRAELPKGGATLVRLRCGAEKAGAVHPMGQLGVRQRIVPLGVTLERFGAARPGVLRHFRLGSVAVGVGGDTLTIERTGTTPLREYFAPAQFFDMSDDEKLAAESFEPMNAGASGYGASGWALPSASGATAPWVARDVFRRTITVNDDRAPTRDRMDSNVMAAAIDQTRPPDRSGPVAGFGLRDASWVIVSTADLRPMGPTGNAPFADMPELAADGADTQAGARAALRSHLARHPEDRDALRVIARDEIEEAA